jgi:RNA polymerase sigma-70 factor (ECF subfamily)
LADAEEVVQDVFVRLWRKADQYDPARGSFSSWLMAIAHNRVIDVVRRRGNGFPSAEEIEAVLEAAEDPALDPAEEALVSVRSRLVIQALRELPLEQRRVLVLAYFGGLSQSSIAETLGWPLGTVKKRVRLGLRKLQLSLESELAPEAREAQER